MQEKEIKANMNKQCSTSKNNFTGRYVTTSRFKDYTVGHIKDFIGTSNSQLLTLMPTEQDAGGIKGAL